MMIPDSNLASRVIGSPSKLLIFEVQNLVGQQKLLHFSTACKPPFFLN